MRRLRSWWRGAVESVRFGFDAGFTRGARRHRRHHS